MVSPKVPQPGPLVQALVVIAITKEALLLDMLVHQLPLSIPDLSDEPKRSIRILKNRKKHSTPKKKKLPPNLSEENVGLA